MNFTLQKKLSDFIWINGKFVPWDEAYIHVLTHSLHYSGAVYEGERAYNGRIFKLEEHTQRLLKSAEYMHLKVNHSAKEINDATYELLEKNSLIDAYIRPLIWRSSETIGLYNPNFKVNILIMAVHSKHDFVQNLKLMLSPWRKPDPNALPCQAKSSAHYAMGVISQQISKDNGFDDSLVLDYEGYIAECNVANIFFGKKNKIITPIADRFLNGITRQVVIDLAKNSAFSVSEERISLENIKDYDYCFMTGTSKEIGGIAEINLQDRVIFFPDPQKRVSLLQSEYGKMVGK